MCRGSVGSNSLPSPTASFTTSQQYTTPGNFSSILYARNTVDALGADIRLFYNDYNTFYAEKRDAIIALLMAVLMSARSFTFMQPACVP